MATAMRRRGLLTGRAARLLTDAATVVRKTVSQDETGGEVDKLTSYGPYPCRLASRRSALERVVGEQLVAETTWTLELLPGTDLLPSDQVIVKGSTYEVVDSNADATDAVLLTAQLRRLR